MSVTIFPKLDYGSIIYSSSNQSKSLDPLHNTSLRIALEAFRTSPTNSLTAESEIPPLKYRRLKLMLNYACKTLANQKKNPAYENLFSTLYNEEYSKKPKYPAPVGIRLKQYLETNQIIIPHILPNEQPPPPQITTSIKETTNIIFNPENKKCYFTIGPTASSIKQVIIINNHIKGTYTLTEMCTDFTCIAFAILTVLNKLKFKTYDQFIVTTDSKKLIQEIQNPYTKSSIVIKIQYEISKLENKNIEIELAYLPQPPTLKINKEAPSKNNPNSAGRR